MHGWSGMRIDQPLGMAGKSGPISQAINAAINTPVIWSIMKIGARNAMTKTAEKSGIPWKQTVAELQACEQVRGK